MFNEAYITNSLESDTSNQCKRFSNQLNSMLLNPFYSGGFLIRIRTINMGLSILYFKGSQVVVNFCP